jgi:hypothetical protein
MRITGSHAPISVKEPVPGKFVFDLGVNFAGRPKVQFLGLQAGQTVRMWPAELLMPDGTIDQMSMTGAQHPGPCGVEFAYTSNGAAREVWEPQFSYTGFRYVQVEGAARSQIEQLSGQVIHLDLPPGGTFTCDNAELNKIHALIGQAVKSNLASVMTDCPTREKLGWLEQAYLNASTVLCNWDAITLYEKATQDMVQAQLPSGMVPSIAPEFITFVDAQEKDTIFRDRPSGVQRSCWPLGRPIAAMAIRKSSSVLGRRCCGTWTISKPTPRVVFSISALATGSISVRNARALAAHVPAHDRNGNALRLPGCHVADGEEGGKPSRRHPFGGSGSERAGGHPGEIV